MTIYTPGTLETDPKKQNMALQQHAASITTAQANIASNTTNITTNTTNIAANTAAIATLNSATYVNSIAGNHGAFTLGNGLSNTVNDIEVSLSKVTNTLSSDVTLNTNAFFDGPSCAQGTAGTWLAVGQVTILDVTAGATFNAKLWDGTTVISAAAGIVTAALNEAAHISFTGIIANPAGNIKISVQDTNGSPNGRIKFNLSGTSKDSTLSVVRII